MEHQNDTTMVGTITTVSQRREYTAYCGCCDCLWMIATFEGWLKMLQWLFTLLTFVILLTEFNVPIELYKYYPEYGVMILLGITSWLFVNIHIILKLTHLFERLPVFCLEPMVGVACCLLGAICFIIVSAIIQSRVYGLTAPQASATCGFIQAVLFLFESLYICCCGRREARETTGRQTVTRVDNGPPYRRLNQNEVETEEQPETPHEFPV